MSSAVYQCLLYLCPVFQYPVLRFPRGATVLWSLISQHLSPSLARYLQSSTGYWIVRRWWGLPGETVRIQPLPTTRVEQDTVSWARLGLRNRIDMNNLILILQDKNGGHFWKVHAICNSLLKNEQKVFCTLKNARNISEYFFSSG